MTGFLLHDYENEIPDMFQYIEIENAASDVAQLDIKESQLPVVIQWNNASLQQNNAPFPVLNPAEGIENCSDYTRMKNIFQCNGISTFTSEDLHNEQENRMVVRRYYALIFQQEVVALYRARGTSAWMNPSLKNMSRIVFQEVQLQQKNKEIKQVGKLAIRAVYALGLDFGGVYIVVTLSGKLKVVNVTPSPKLKQNSGKRLAERIQDFIVQYKLKESQQAVLGADPEFVLRHGTKGNIILASEFFKKNGRVGCDSIWLREDATHTRLPLGELRPRPDTDPRQLIVNIYKTMLAGIKKINQPAVEWLAGGMPMKDYPIGGHIHFSQVKLTSQLLRSLDNYLALPYMLIESRESIQRRPKYGFLGDFRTQFHGGFEYRTLPSWLLSPCLAKGAIALAKLIASCHFSLSYFPLYNYGVQKSFYEGEKEKLKPVVEEIIWRITNQPEYSEYADFIDPFWEAVLSGKDWNEDTDIRIAWRLPPYQNLYKYRR